MTVKPVIYGHRTLKQVLLERYVDATFHYSNFSSGFLKARSCLANLLCFLEELTKWVDDGSPVDVIYLDFQKAFDKVPHQRLILKLKSHSMGSSIVNWIEQWLTDRRQRVVVDGEVSSWKSVYLITLYLIYHQQHQIIHVIIISTYW